MKYSLLLLLCLAVSVNINAQNELKTEGLNISLDNMLKITSLSGETELLASDTDTYLLRIKSDGKILLPIGANWKKNEVSVSFSNGTAVTLLCTEETNYLKFEVISIVGEDKIDVIFYGPIRTIMDETIGEIIGVVREDGYAVGIQSLNAKTTGGKMTNPDGSDNARGTTATKEDYGSNLQAYCINRYRERVHNIWNNRIPNAVIPANPDGNLAGSAIAIFGCKEPEVLSVIESIEISEGLPHSTINGVWSKLSIDSNKPYFITTYTEENIEEIIEYTKRLGFNAVYHSHPFANWGHFDLIEKQFPNGWDGMKTCVDKANNDGIRLGVHILTNFIHTTDPYITPVPHDDLMIYSKTRIIKDLEVDDTEIFIEDPGGYDYKDACQAIIIENEIIRFSGVSEEEPYRLLNCKRGEYNTNPGSYKANTDISRLADHAYKTLFPNWTLQKELINTLARFFNYTGVGQLDFDGHEGGWGTGEGEYGMDYFSEQLQKQVNHELRNGSSRSNHFYWHTVSYLNWGEPWYGGFTKSQGHYRYQNQALLKRNYIPNMLGWFLLNSTTTLQEFEYMLARSAGYDAGYALYSTIESFKANDEFDQIVEAINTWEEARLKKIFDDRQLKVLQDVNNDFSLMKNSDNEFELQYYYKSGFELLDEIVQPGQPNDIEVIFEVEESQPLYLVFGAVGSSGSINSITIELNGYESHTIITELKSNWAVTYRGDNKILVYDELGRLKTSLDFDAEKITLPRGSNSIRVSAEFSDGADISLNGYIRLKDKIERIKVE